MNEKHVIARSFTYIRLVAYKIGLWENPFILNKKNRKSMSLIKKFLWKIPLQTPTNKFFKRNIMNYNDVDIRKGEGGKWGQMPLC